MMKNLALMCLKNKKPVKPHQNCPKFNAIPEIMIHKKAHVRCYNCRYFYNHN